MTVLTPTKNTQGFPEMEGSNHFTAADFVRSVNKKVTARRLFVLIIIDKYLLSDPSRTFLLMSEPPGPSYFSKFQGFTKALFSVKKVEFCPM